MNHLCAFYEAIDSASPVEINNIVDDVLTRASEERFLVPEEFDHLLWAAALGTNVTRAKVETPSLGVRRMSCEIIPRRRGSIVFDLNKPEIFVPPSPISLVASEELAVHAAEDGTGATAVYALVALGPATQPPLPAGDLRIVRATGATVLTPNKWTTVSVTPELSLEPGRYALIGFLAISANAIAARVIITGQNWRPGMPALAGSEAAALDFDPLRLEQLHFEMMGEFTHINPPQFQFLSSAADTSQTVYLYVIKVG